MKKILIFMVVLFLVGVGLVPTLYAKEYKFTKECNPAQLADELKAAGINLSDKNQIGYMETIAAKEIRIVLKEGVTINEIKLQEIIDTHVPFDFAVERKLNIITLRLKLENLGLTNKEINILVGD